MRSQEPCKFQYLTPYHIEAKDIQNSFQKNLRYCKNGLLNGRNPSISSMIILP